MKPIAQEILTFAASVVAALAIVAGVAVVRGAFLEPPGGPPGERDIALPLTASREFEAKAGNLQVSDLFVRNRNQNNQWASQFPHMERIRKFVAGSGATVFCSPGYELVSCMGSRQFDAIDTCPEDVCGFVGVIPLQVVRAGAAIPFAGCKVGIDPGRGTAAVVDMFCMGVNR